MAEQAHCALVAEVWYHQDWYETGFSVCVSTRWDKTGKALTEGVCSLPPFTKGLTHLYLWLSLHMGADCDGTKKITPAKTKCGISYWVTEMNLVIMSLGSPKVALGKVPLCKDRGQRLLSFGRSRVSGLGDCISNSIPQEFHLEPKIATKRQKETLATQI